MLCPGARAMGQGQGARGQGPGAWEFVQISVGELTVNN